MVFRSLAARYSGTAGRTAIPVAGAYLLASMLSVPGTFR